MSNPLSMTEFQCTFFIPLLGSKFRLGQLEVSGKKNDLLYRQGPVSLRTFGRTVL